jgi:hypothetical protein
MIHLILEIMKYTFGFGLIIFLSVFNQGKADAAIVDSTRLGFTVKHEKNMSVDPMTLHNIFCKEIGQWWDPEHTWSGKSENLYIQVYPGGAFGEQMESGKAVRHMSVIYLDPGKVFRMQGALGPLQQYAVTGIMTLEFKRNGDSTHVSLTYTVGGYIPGGASKFAAVVDQVLDSQFQRYTGYALRKK